MAVSLLHLFRADRTWTEKDVVGLQQGRTFNAVDDFNREVLATKWISTYPQHAWCGRFERIAGYPLKLRLDNVLPAKASGLLGESFAAQGKTWLSCSLLPPPMALY